MRVRNDPEPDNQFSEFMRLQTEFYTRLTEETLKYLRRVQAASSPAIPGTVLLPEGDLLIESSGVAGSQVELQLEVENRQRVHCVVTPMLSPLVHGSGATWFPSVMQQASMLVAPGETETVRVQLALPPKLPDGLFRGALLLQGFRESALPVAIRVERGETHPGTSEQAS